MKRKSIISAALLCILAITGCDTQRLTQFGSFAAAGTAYVTTFHSFVQDAGDAFIAADSATLITARNIAGAGVVSSNAATYTKNLTDEDAQLQEYLSNLKKLDDQASLLGAYFAAITNITSGKASSATTTSIDGLVDSINKINPEIENASFAGKNVKDFIGPATQLIVAHFEVKELDKSLQQSAPIIDKALTLQEAAVAAIAAQLKASLAVTLQTDESSKVINPYVANAPLPGTWASDRAAYVKENLNLQTANSATAAIQSLHKAFTALVTDKHSSIDFASLYSLIGQMAGYTQAAQATK